MDWPWSSLFKDFVYSPWLGKGKDLQFHWMFFQIRLKPNPRCWSSMCVYYSFYKGLPPMPPTPSVRQETGKPLQDSSPNLPKPSPVKLPNVAFWRPKETERWCNATTNKRGCNHQDQGPKNARIQPQAEANSSSKGYVGRASETGKPQQDSSPNLPKPSPVKLPNVAFWRPKETERWCNATTNKRGCNQQDQGPKNARIQPQAEANSSSKGCRACIRNRETPAGFKPKPTKTIPRKTA